MKDIKVIDTLNDITWWNGRHAPIEFFAESVARTRAEGDMGVSIKDIAKCFKCQFDEAELSALIHELNMK
jgi:hypothetical protein